jgi:hypothetical protein
VVYHTETGLTPTYNEAAFIANTGTRFLIRFKDVPDGVALAVDPVVGDDEDDLFLQRITGYNSYRSGGSASGSGSVSLDDGEGEVLYEVQGLTGVNDSAETNSFSIPVYVSYEAGVDLGQAQVWMSYAPFIGEPGAEAADAGTASTIYPEPRFRPEDPDYRDLFEITPCRTLLLFPYLTSAPDWDTGIAIANTSEDPFGTPGQDGACTLYFYPDGGDSESHETNEVPSGDTLLGTLAYGDVTGKWNFPQVLNFTGYMIAVCEFQYAHGFAFISTLNLNLAQGYLALIIPDKYNLRSPEAFSLGAGVNDGEQLTP